MEVLLFELCAIMCVQTSNIKVFGTKDHVPVSCIVVFPT